MSVPSDRKYTETHEWFMVEGDVVTMGITQYAADELTDITYVDLPDVGASVAAGEPVGEVESVKATSDVYSAVTGEVVETNNELADHPEILNEDAFDRGWLLRIRADSLKPLNKLMDAREYEAHIAL
ncbi:MAG TPA: glycine cleavage system protein GcvH [Phycisphaerae bacterium]|nr:glycine cleavage system protein GcvH [Phycisphaerae bacterium]